MFCFLWVTVKHKVKKWKVFKHGEYFWGLGIYIHIKYVSHLLIIQFHVNNISGTAHYGIPNIIKILDTLKYSLCLFSRITSFLHFKRNCRITSHKNFYSIIESFAYGGTSDSCSFFFIRLRTALVEYKVIKKFVGRFWISNRLTKMLYTFKCRVQIALGILKSIR